MGVQVKMPVTGLIAAPAGPPVSEYDNVLAGMSESEALAVKT